MVSLGAGQYKGRTGKIHTASWVVVTARASKPMYWQKLRLSPVQVSIFNSVIRSSLVEQRNINPKTSPASLGHLAVVGKWLSDLGSWLNVFVLFVSLSRRKSTGGTAERTPAAMTRSWRGKWQIPAVFFLTYHLECRWFCKWFQKLSHLLWTS